MNKDKFLTLFQETMEMEDQEISVDDKFRDYEEWDSLAVLSVLALINEEFGITLKREELDKLQTIEEMFEFVSTRG